jgi:hypothetical protein
MPRLPCGRPKKLAHATHSQSHLWIIMPPNQMGRPFSRCNEDKGWKISVEIGGMCMHSNSEEFQSVIEVRV